MKQLFSFLAAGLLAIAAWGQTTVTLTVDMTNEEVSADGVHVAGNFQGWQAGDTPMTDNLDGTYSHTFTVDSAMTIQYKFINGNAWGSDESVPGACAFDGNRQLVVDGMMGSVSTLACYGNCAACGLTTVRFRVDMTNEEVSAFGVHVAGDFQGWDPAGTSMTDEDGDMVYEAIASFDATGMDGISYKFINGNAWTDPNELVAGDCGDENGNRVLALDGTDLVVSADAAGTAYCFNSCSSCVLPLAVTFTVDMSVVASVSDLGVHLAGAFQGWTPADTPMSDNGDGTWSVTLEMAPGTYEFKFVNSNDWDGNEENMEGSGCNNGQNRIATFDADNNTYTACFNTCPEVACTPDPDPANITFRVNMSEQTLAEDDVVFVWGGFTGWQGGAIAMTDADADGVWEHTAEISGSANVDYKYSIGHPNEEGVIEEDGVFVLENDTTNWFDAGCGVENGFGGYNRRHVRSGAPEILDVVCFNQCADCAGSDASVGEFGLAFNAYPNPTQGMLMLAGDLGQVQLQMTDLHGRMVLDQRQVFLNGTHALDLSALGQGTYQLIVWKEGSRSVKKVVVQ